MNKKLLSILLACAMVLSLGLTACGNKETEIREKSIAYIVGNLGDKSFNDSGEKGMETLRGEGWDVKTVETGGAENADKYEDAIRDVLDQGYKYLAGSSTYGEVFLKLCNDFPNNYFLIFDDIPGDESTIPSNVAYVSYAQNEGSYLVGWMAAGMTTNKVVAVNVGMNNPIIADFVTGFIEGVKAKDPSVKVITAECGSWSDAAIMKNICDAQQRDNGVDVFYQVAGGCGFGMFESCTNTGTYAIGVDSDQYTDLKEGSNPEQADCILTSMLKEVGNSMIAFFHAVENGDDVWGKYTLLGLADNSVGYAINENFEKLVPADLRNEMAGLGERVKSGDLQIKSYFDFASEADYQSYVAAAG